MRRGLTRGDLGVDLVSRHVVPRDQLIALGAEVQLAAVVRETMRPRQRAHVHAPQFLARGEIDHRDRFPGALRAAIVGDERQLAVGRDFHFVRSVADRNRGR